MPVARVTLRDIAKAAKTSHVTVSLALRNHKKISQKKRQLIQKLAQEMGYRPDPMLRALAEHRRAKSDSHFQAAIAWLNYFPVRVYPDRYAIFNRYRDGAKKRSEELGYAFEDLYPRIDKLTPSVLRRILTARGINGLLVPPHLEPHAHWDFDLTGFSAVTFGYSMGSPHLHVVGNNQASSSVLAVKKLREYGHRRIGFILCEDLHERTAHKFAAGFLGEICQEDYFHERPIFFYKDHLKSSDWESWYRDFRPDAIILSGENEVSCLIEAGKNIPTDVSVCLLTPHKNTKKWACVDQREEEIGALSVDTLIALLHRNETGPADNPHHILIESTWRDGKSVRQRKPNKTRKHPKTSKAKD